MTGYRHDMIDEEQLEQPLEEPFIPTTEEEAIEMREENGSD